jgi:acylphosphatase
MSPAAQTVRKHMVFRGWVQGVGFRWRAAKAASLYGCTGWVRNEWDGSVTMELQGSQEQIRQVLAAVDGSRYIRIESMDCRQIPPDEDERGFHAR